MVGRQVLRYLPATLIPPLSTFIAIYIYTRLLSPTEMGTYTFTLTLSLLWQSIFFTWLQISIVRFYSAEFAGSGDDVLTIAHRGFGLAGLLAIIVFIGVSALGLFEDIWVTWLALPMAFSRSLLSLQLACFQAQFRTRRFNIVEVGQTIFGVTLGVVLVEFYHLGAAGALVGVLIGNTMGLLVNLPGLRHTFFRHVTSSSLLREFVAYGIPLSLGSILGSALSSVDRIVIAKFLGLPEVAAYSLAFSLVDRPVSLIFTSISVAIFPVTMHAIETQGADAARTYLRHGIALMLSLAIPACVGIAALDKNMVWVLLGDNFHTATWPLMSWVTLCSFLSGITYHCLGQSFHFARQTWKVLFSLAPAAAVNIIACLISVPIFGLWGAIGANIVSLLLFAVVTWILGYRAFPLDIPLLDAAKAAIASAIMYVCLKALHLPLTSWGLILGIAIGAAIYGCIAIVLDIADLRNMIATKLLPRLRRS